MSDGSRKAASKSTTFHFVAGLGSGVFSAALLQPIDLLKTRVQQSGHHSLTRVLADICNQAAVASHAGGVKPFVPSAVAAALWRGTVPSALRTGFGSAVYFTSLNAIRQSAARIPFLAAAPDRSLRNDPSATNRATPDGQQVPNRSSGTGSKHSSSLPKLSNTGNLLAGATARAFAGFLLMPLTIIKVRYESNLYSYSSVAGAAADIYRRDGLRGFFAGFGATAFRDAPYAGLYVLFYEQSKKRLSLVYGDGDSINKSSGGIMDAELGRMGVSRAAAINFASGISAAAVCSAISNPFDAVKTRIQLQPGQYRNMVHAARRMFTEEGFRSFLDGLALRMTRKALSSALAWTVYEEMIRRAEVTWSGSRAKRDSVL
ncbi:hypothetical protein VTK73DRAFT_7659 [Phialemonium thermophilum]|uniref:Mitochondrial glycine transporter n=1 Tax=Phialemonium thermophilum TaxID=223376 RepID=A0ABR3Y7G7_9PEZI